jgi:2-C-methyl-D-erythritol 4-phosphate cytidylyltransferase
VAGKPLLSWTISRFEEASSIDEITVVVAEEYLELTGTQVVDSQDFRKVRRIVTGGATRRESVLNGLEKVSPSSELAAIHDGARPLVSPQDIDAVVAAAETSGAAILAAKATDTIKRAEAGRIFATLDRSCLYLAQTPQVFHREMILEAHRRAAEAQQEYTDDASMVEAVGQHVALVEPTAPNIKVTTPHDVIMIEALLGREVRG